LINDRNLWSKSQACLVIMVGAIFHPQSTRMKESNGWVLISILS